MLNDDDFNLVKTVFHNELLSLSDRRAVSDLVKTDHPDDSNDKHIKVYLKTSIEKEAISIAKEFQRQYKIDSKTLPGMRKSIQIDRFTNTFFMIFTEQDVRALLQQTDYPLAAENTAPPRKRAKFI